MAPTARCSSSMPRAGSLESFTAGVPVGIRTRTSTCKSSLIAPTKSGGSAPRIARTLHRRRFTACHRNTSPFRRRLQHGVGHLIGRERLGKGRRSAAPLAERLQKIGDLVNESMLVPDLQAGNPPLAHIRMLPI